MNECTPPSFQIFLFRIQQPRHLDPQRCRPGSVGTAFPGAVTAPEGREGGDEKAGEQFCLFQQSWQWPLVRRTGRGKKMTKTSGPIYHLPIVLNKLLELLGFEALPLLPPYETNPTKCLSTGTAECWQHCCQLKGFLQWGLIHGSCQGGAVERMESLKWENKGGRTSSKGIKAPRESQSFERVYAQGWAGHLWQNLCVAQADGNGQVPQIASRLLSPLLSSPALQE